MGRLRRNGRQTLLYNRIFFALFALLLAGGAARLALKSDAEVGKAAFMLPADDEKNGKSGGFRRWIRDVIADNSLSIMFFALFLVCLAAQAETGWIAYDNSLRQSGFPDIAFGAYLRTGHFLDGIFSNWQAAVLQLAALVLFSSVLRQKGAAHSRKPAAANYRTLGFNLQRSPTLREWLLDNSLSLAFVALFVIGFALHLLFGEWQSNEDAALRHLPPTTLSAYATSAGFWFSAFECWEAEFGAIGVYVVFSIFLRQKLSPESKPVSATNKQTGGTNE
jgi:hypothetical protein